MSAEYQTQEDYSSQQEVPNSYQGVYLGDEYTNNNQVTSPLFNSSVPFDNYNYKNEPTNASSSAAVAGGGHIEPSSGMPSPGVFASPGGDLSDLEAAILRSSAPIHIEEMEEIEVNGNRGFWANKTETATWRGETALNEYPVNEDPEPEIIYKKTNQIVEYVQEMAIRYLKPPTPEPPGEIIINQLPDITESPAPPIIIRQQPPRPQTPEPIVIREAPPQPPEPLGKKIITIAGRKLPPPPRKVIVERLAPLPEKPRAVLIERWLPFSNPKRKVIYNKRDDKVEVLKPKNIIIQWEPPKVSVRKEVKYLGVVRANPVEYAQRYGNILMQAEQLPHFVSDIKTPKGITLAAEMEKKLRARNKRPNTYELDGDVEALKLVDLDREGLSEYREQLIGRSDATFRTQSPIHTSNYYQYPSSSLQMNHHGSSGAPTMSTVEIGTTGGKRSTTIYSRHHSNMASGSTYSIPTKSSRNTNANHHPVVYQKPHNNAYQNEDISEVGVIDEVLRLSLGGDGCGFGIDDRSSSTESRRLEVEEAEKALLRVNSRLGRRQSQDDVKQFFSTIDVNMDGTVDLDEFRSALISINRDHF